MIRVKDLKKEFEGFYALNGVNLNVAKGSVYGLVGPNGAGKSTLIRHLTGVYKQNEGELLIDGQPVFENDEIKNRIAYIPDDVFFFMQANINDMMKFYKGIYKNFNLERYNKLLGVFELVNSKNAIRKMSKGMQKQASFLLAICSMADVIILDEPVDGLDSVMRRQVWSILLQDVAERGTTVLVSSHNLRELEDVCDTVGIMNNGRVMLEKSLESLQGNIQKVQIAFGSEIPDEFRNALTLDRGEKTGSSEDKAKSRLFICGSELLHMQKSGSVYNLIMRGSAEELRLKMEEYSPVLCDILPLTLEEIFIYELGGENYAVKDILI